MAYLDRVGGDRAGRRAGDGPPRSRVYAAVVAVVEVLVRLLFDVRVVGRVPARGPIVFAANHVSFRDPMVLVVLLHRAGYDARFLTVRAVFDRPAVGTLFRLGRYIPVGDGVWPRAVAARRALEAVAAGDSVVCYLEGGIPPPGRLASARPGVAWLARRSGAPIVPVASAGMERVGRRGGWLRRRPAVVVIGSPVPAPVPGSDDRAAAARVLVEVRRLAGEARSLARAAQLPSTSHRG